MKKRIVRFDVQIKLVVRMNSRRLRKSKRNHRSKAKRCQQIFFSHSITPLHSSSNIYYNFNTQFILFALSERSIIIKTMKEGDSNQPNRQTFKKEFEDWEKIQQKELGKLISAKRHLYVNIGAYLLISVIEGILSSISGSQTLKADAFNNLSGIISTVLLIIGIHIASDIDDDDIAGIPLPKISLRKTGNDQRIQFTRWRYETIFTLVTGIIMIVIASSVIIDGIKALLNPSERIVPQPIALLGAAIASIIMV